MASSSYERVEMVDVLPRSGHVAVTADKFMLIWGGYTELEHGGNKYLPAGEINIYHSTLKYWTLHFTNGNTPNGTSGASAYLVGEKLYVFAGHTDEGNSNRLYSLDLHTFTWTDLTPKHGECNLSRWPSPRDKFASWTMDKKLFCFGGFGVPLRDYLNDSGSYHPDPSTSHPERGWNNQLVVYDIDSGEWSNPKCKGPVPLPRAAHTAVRFSEKVYIFGGRHSSLRLNDLHCFDLDSYTWSGEIYIDGACPCGRSWHTFTAVSDNVAFLYGGYSSDGTPLSDAWQLNMYNKQWTQVTVCPDRPRLWHTSCCTEDGEILVYGGCCNDILELEEPTIQPKDILSFHLHPYKLQRLCLEAVYTHKDLTENDWCSLPKPLGDWLQKKKNVNKLKKETSVQWKKEKVGSTCAVS